MRTLIVGCGYVGTALAALLRGQGHAVSGLRRSAEGAEALKAEGIEPIVADITRPEELSRIPAVFDWVVNTVSSSKGGAEEYRAVYLEGMRNLVEWLGASPPRKFVYTSSTSVYPQTDGSQVKESSAAEPSSDTGRTLVAAENLLLDAFKTKSFPAVILRAAGIYGPDRGHLFQQFLRDEAVVNGRGERIINMIHRDDLAGCIMAALKNGRPGEIYNAVDDEPTPQVHFLRWLSETLGKNMPPFVPAESAPQGKRAATHKRVLNRKIKMELGYQFRYPTFRQGYTAEIQRLQDAGKL
jgi:nucleoside-diphosphate-sugar epimerase